MSPLFTSDGKILVVDGKLAASKNCCCDSCDGPCPCRPGCCCGVVAADQDTRCMKITQVCSPSSANIYRPGLAPVEQPVSLRLEGVPEPIEPLPAPFPSLWTASGQYDSCSGKWMLIVTVCGPMVGGDGAGYWRGVATTAEDCYPVAGPVALYQMPNCIGQGCNRMPQLFIDRP